jgi:hypothetical protein
MLVDEVKSDALTERANARQALADAIAGVDEARERLGQAKLAVELATDRAIELRNRVDALSEQLSLAKATAPDGIIAALLRGDDMQTERSPTEIARAEFDALQGQLEAVRRARQIAEDEVGRRKEAIGLAEMRVKRMVGRVLQSSGAAETLMHGLLDLEREIIRRRLGLAVLLRNDGVPVALLSEVERLLDGHALPTRAATVDHWANNPASQAWASAMLELQRDPDARLPD